MTRFSPPSRREYLRKQKENHGRHLFGVFPAQYPREILWAMNALPVEIWDPPLEVKHAHAHLQSHICPVVKRGLELILQGKADILDAFLFPHTCDSIQNLGSIVKDTLDPGKPCTFFYNPRAPFGNASRKYFRAQLRDFVSQLETQLGPMDPTELKRRVDQARQLAAIIGRLYDRRAKGALGVSNAEFYAVIRQGEFLHPDDFLPLLEEFLNTSKGEIQEGPVLLLSGILPAPPEMLTLLDQTGARIADDDLLACGRRLLVPPGRARDPLEALTARYFAMPPCPTRGSPVGARVDYLLEKIARSRAKGVIFNTLKFCEPALFDLPNLVEAMKREGVATLILESDLTRGAAGQIATRVEAFVEMIT
jgi:benzoyl-CoA reductase/2-hydroxyglutaryl-CoA dehydratase subunit BcrC/BadD/HgdB